MNSQILNLFQSGTTPQVTWWVAALIALVPAAIALWQWYSNRQKTSAETTGIVKKTEHQVVETFDFTNKALSDGQNLINEIFQKNIKLQTESHEKDSTIGILQLEKAKLQGKVELSLQQRDTAYDEIDKIKRDFEKQLQAERTHCQEQMDGMSERILHLEKQSEDFLKSQLSKPKNGNGDIQGGTNGK